MKLPQNAKSILERLGVCSWSLQPATPADLVQKLKATGLKRVQVDLDPLRDDPAWAGAPAMLAANGIEIISGMFRTVGEDYTTPETIRRTGGLVPDSTWDQNWKNMPATVKVVKQLGIKFASFHAGFLPHSPSDPNFEKLMSRVRHVAKIFGDSGIMLGFETGQESAQALADFLSQLGEPNVGVNFDPANMLLYDNGDPIEALRLLGPHVKACHIKDAIRTTVPGNWGEEVTVGTGQVDWPAFFTTLAEIDFKGYCCFEREAGNQRSADIAAGRAFVQKILA